MDIRKSESKLEESSGQPNKGRRSFLWKSGAGLSAVLAAVVPGVARARAQKDTNLKARFDSLSREVGILRDENRIRLLHQTYENLLDKGMYEEVVNLFTDDSEVVFNGGIFKGKKSGVYRLYCKHFRSGLSGKRIQHIPGILPDIKEEQDMIEVMPDLKSAKARFTYSIQVGTPIIFDSVLVEMARWMGEGIMKWWEGGTYDISYVKDTKDETWKIKRLEYKVLSKANYRPGKPHSTPISVPLFSKVFPEDPAGPSKLLDPVQT
ncbi:MAG: nuclear transport factor 2 family protein [Deltaproteobacteria bacterium]|nr:nuclear transport factor 2 family protein [Deltaproteobacteria bacterium]